MNLISIGLAQAGVIQYKYGDILFLGVNTGTGGADIFVSSTDAPTYLEGNGPKSGRPRVADLVLASADVVALDTVAAKVMGIEVAVQSPEDTILSKLSWGKDSGSEMQYRDALGVALQQWQNLDQEYLRRWAAELDVSELLEKVLTEAARLA